MNGQSARGGAYGFKIDMIEKLSEVKTTDNKKNLLMYIVQTVEKANEKDIVDPNENLEDIELLGNYNKLSLIVKTPLSQLTIDLTELKK